MSEDAAATATELRSFDSLCTKLRTDLGKAYELKKTEGSAAPARIQLSDGAYALLELKSVNRRVWELVGELKTRSQAANAAIDDADLKLQNLQYEKNHLVRQINPEEHLACQPRERRLRLLELRLQ